MLSSEGSSRGTPARLRAGSDAANHGPSRAQCQDFHERGVSRQPHTCLRLRVVRRCHGLPSVAMGGLWPLTRHVRRHASKACRKKGRTSRCACPAASRAKAPPATCPMRVPHRALAPRLQSQARQFAQRCRRRCRLDVIWALRQRQRQGQAANMDTLAVLVPATEVAAILPPVAGSRRHACEAGHAVQLMPASSTRLGRRQPGSRGEVFCPAVVPAPPFCPSFVPDARPKQTTADEKARRGFPGGLVVSLVEFPCLSWSPMVWSSQGQR